jgi:hypothetical protein
VSEWDVNNFSFWNPWHRIQVDNVHLYRGNVITIWLHKEENGDFGGPEMVQVELRVLQDGTPEIYSDGLSARGFHEWHSGPAPKGAVYSDESD